MGEWPDYYRVMHSLSRSRNRARVLVFLYDNRNYPYSIYDIARSSGTVSGNVAGALCGDGKKYRQEDSLIGLGLVRRETAGNCRVRIYSITPQGMNVARLIKRHRCFW